MTLVKKDIDYFSEIELDRHNLCKFYNNLPNNLRCMVHLKSETVGYVLQGYRGPSILCDGSSGDSQAISSINGIQKISFKHAMTKKTLLSPIVFILSRFIQNSSWQHLYFDENSGKLLSNNLERAQEILTEEREERERKAQVIESIAYFDQIDIDTEILQAVIDESKRPFTELIENLRQQGAEAIHNTIQLYTEQECRDNLVNNELLILDAIRYQLQPNDINLLFLRNTLLNQKLLCIKIDALSDNNSAIIILESVISLLKDALAFGEGLGHIKRGNIKNILNELLQEANTLQYSLNLTNNTHLHQDNITSEQRENSAREFANRAMNLLREADIQALRNNDRITINYQY